MSWKSDFLSLRGKIQQEHNHSLKRKHKQNKTNTKPIAYSQSEKCFFWFLSPSCSPTPTGLLSKHRVQRTQARGSHRVRGPWRSCTFLQGNKQPSGPFGSEEFKILRQAQARVERKRSLKVLRNYLPLPATWSSRIQRTRPSRVYRHQRCAAWKRHPTSAAAPRPSSCPGSLNNK